MIIRILKEEEMVHASGLSRYVFDTTLRNRMEFTQSIPFIEKYISESNLQCMTNESKLIVWGAFEGEQLVGVGGLQTDGMITLLYVLPQYANRACGKNLLEVMTGYAKDVLGLSKLVVNATPAWTCVYFKKQGFVPMNTNTPVGIPYMPMQMSIGQTVIQKKEKITGKTILLAILSCIGFATITGVLFMLSYLM